MANPNVAMPLEEAVKEVLAILTGLDLDYEAEQDRFQAVTRALNRAVRANATEHEWSYYSSLENVGLVHEGDVEVALRASIRPRIIGDDAVRLVDENERVMAWAYILPRDSLHKYDGRVDGLWAAYTRSSLRFSRPLGSGFEGLTIQVPVMREPNVFRLPPDNGDVPDEIKEQLLDFDFPDVVILRAAFYAAQSDPLYQPRSQILEAQYKDLMYQLVERDDRATDAPYLNEFFVPITNDIYGTGWNGGVRHPHSDARR